MKVIYNSLIPFKGFSAINLFGVVFARKEYKPLSQKTLTHEAIHTAQMRELWYVGFYVWYMGEWLVRLCIDRKTAYRSILFEQEAYLNDQNSNYLNTRKRFAWLKLNN